MRKIEKDLDKLIAHCFKMMSREFQDDAQAIVDFMTQEGVFYIKEDGLSYINIEKSQALLEAGMDSAIMILGEQHEIDIVDILGDRFIEATEDPKEFRKLLLKLAGLGGMSIGPEDAPEIRIEAGIDDDTQPRNNSPILN